MKSDLQVSLDLDNLETNKIVLVHGEGFGAWSWYKIIPLLDETGLHSVALDLAGSGMDHIYTNSITTLAEYSKPLIDFFEGLPEDERVKKRFQKISESFHELGFHTCIAILTNGFTGYFGWP